MVIIYGSASYSVDVTPPLVLKFKVSKDQLINARKRFGTTIDTATVNGAKFKFIADVCPEETPECATPIPAFNITLIGYKDLTFWSLDVWFLEYYVSPSIKISNKLFDYGKESDVNVEVLVSGSRIRVTANGVALIDTDMMKSIGKLVKITSDTYYFDATGTNINKYIDELAFILNVEKPIELTSIINLILPIAIAVGIMGGVFAVIRQLQPFRR